MRFDTSAVVLNLFVSFRTGTSSLAALDPAVRNAGHTLRTVDTRSQQTCRHTRHVLTLICALFFTKAKQLIQN
jgi:hypothetical protein